MKSLFKNSVYYILYRLINVIYPLITATYVSRVLKPAGVGEAALAQNIVIFLVAVALLGIPNYGVREVSKAKGNELNRLFTELFIINFISTIFIYSMYCFAINVLSFEINKTLYNIYGVILLLNIINVDWFYQGKEEFKYITVRSAIIKILSIFEIFLFVKKESDICTYGLIFALAYAGNYIFNAVNLRKYVSLSLKGIDLKRHLNSVMALAITAISNEIYVTLDTFMLGILSTNIEIGYYSNSMKLMRILINVVTAVGTVILPRLSKLQNENQKEAFDEIINKVIKILMWITLPCTIGIFVMAQPIVVVLFGKAFEPAAAILCILSLLIIPRAFSNMSLQVLICTKNDTKTSVVYFTGMLINCILNSFLIRNFGAQGAAIASVISEAYICVVLFVYSKRLYILKISSRFVLSLVGSSVLLGMSVLLLRYTLASRGINEFLTLCLGVSCGVVIYWGASMLSRNEVTFYLMNKTIAKLSNKRGKL